MKHDHAYTGVVGLDEVGFAQCIIKVSFKIRIIKIAILVDVITICGTFFI